MISFISNSNDSSSQYSLQYVLEFFDSIPNFETYYTDEYVEIEYQDKEFDFSYRYLIQRG